MVSSQIIAKRPNLEIDYGEMKISRNPGHHLPGQSQISTKLFDQIFKFGKKSQTLTQGHFIMAGTG